MRSPITRSSNATVRRAIPLAALVALGLGSGLRVSAAADDGQPRDALQTAILAKIDERIITVQDFLREADRRSGGDPSPYASPEKRQALLEEMIVRETLLARAFAEGYDHDPAVVEAMTRVMLSRLAEDHLNADLEGVTVSDADIRQRFEEERSLYRLPGRVRGAMIFLQIPAGADHAAIAELQQSAAKLREEAESLAPDVVGFGTLALDHSDDRATRYIGGVLPWMARGGSYKWPEEVVEAILSIPEEGGVGPVVRTDEGFYVVKLVERQAERPLPFEMYEAGIRRRLIRERQEAIRERFYERMKKQTEIEVNLELLDGIPGLSGGDDGGSSEDEPPGLPPG